MQQSMVRRAAAEYAQGNYLAALDLYRRLSEFLGEHNFRANIRLCERKLSAPGRRDCKQLALKTIRVAGVMDEFTFHSYAPECNLLALTPDHVTAELDAFNPDLLFIESAWRGKDDLWNRKIGSLSRELKNALQWCNERQVPTVFWNKEDPIHFETFLTTAKQFDYVFTTDIDCIARYKAALGHDRVFLLPFACQPAMHNPLELYARKDAFCFAGAYYVRYPERTRDLENYVAEFPNFRPLEIFDRNFGKSDVNYQFPEKYRPYIVGTLPFNEIDKAYKGYRYAINLNSIKQSQTMFARRVYELLGSNTVTVSNYSRGVRLLFGDLVIASDSGKEIVERLQRLDDEAVQKHQLAGLRKVMLEHSYAHRLAYVARKALGWCGNDALPGVAVVAHGTSIDACRPVVENFLRQSYPRKRLLLVLDAAPAADTSAIPADAPVSVMSSDTAARATIGDLFAADEWVAPMAADDYYGPNYLLDLLVATRYSDAPVIGKLTRYQADAGTTKLIDAGHAYRPANRLPMRSSVARATALPLGLSLPAWLQAMPGDAWQIGGLSIDPFNYCQHGRAAADGAALANRVDDPAIDCGMPVDQLLRSAENIPAAEFDESTLPKWNATKLFQLLGSIAHPNIDIEVTPDGLRMTSTLPDGKHEYLYVRENLPISALPTGRVLETNLDAAPGLDIQYVFVFLDDKKRKIHHVIHTANRNHTATVPAEAAFVRFGWRICGSGASTVKHLLWGHARLDSALLLGRSATLVLTNHYPNYDDLYRNGFVHSRVKAYQARGVRVDVFRLRTNSATSYHEFQNVDVLTGTQEALAKLLDSGRYTNVLVHFLSPEMWDVLERYPGLKKIVWVHGAEIQPWHRRDYNFQTDQERAKAMHESDQRMAFWRGILNPLASNLKLVFVSRYFAEEVFEDVGFRLPDEAYSIIHNPIDTNLFSYQVKPAEQRKRVLSIRPYASRKYANDLSVQAILKLSDLPCFKDMEFRLIGDGKLFDETLEPLRGFSNVTIQRGFLTHAEIAALHKEYGICLTPTRMDAQGVSRDEAMSSGLVPITSAVAAIPEFVDAGCGILADAEDADGLAAGLAALYNDPSRFETMSCAAAARVRRQCAVDQIVGDELDQFIRI
ncbi:MAG: glycosyltransferase [Rhodocyclaceae bacterium]|nr:glycosyltransferase [Rhodocyclaceae bacterium]